MSVEFKKIVESGKIDNKLLQRFGIDVGYLVSIQVKDGIDAKNYASSLIKEKTLKDSNVEIKENVIEGYVSPFYIASLSQRPEVEKLSVPDLEKYGPAVRV
jgi:hypothetical protein